MCYALPSGQGTIFLFFEVMLARKRKSVQAADNTRKSPQPGFSRPTHPLSKHILVGAGLCLIALLAYSNSFRAGFVFDNHSLILEDPRVTQASAKNVQLILQHNYWWPKGETHLYRPVTTLSYLFNYSILDDRDDPSGYHWFNFFFHALNVVLLFALCLRFLKKLWPAAFIAGVWAVHPVLTESVTNIIGRSDLLAAASMLSGFRFYLKSTESTGFTRFAWLAGLGTSTFIGVFSKESAVAILGVVVLFELTWWKERHQLRGLLLGCAAMAPALLALLYQRSVVLSGLVPSESGFLDNPLMGANFITARLTAIAVIAKYLWLLIWPAHLSSDYSYAAIPLAKGSPANWLAWIVVLLAAAVAVWQFRRNRLVFFFAAFAFITFFPVSNLPFLLGTIMAERFLYLPAIAFAVCLVLGAYFVAERLGNPTAAPVILCLILAAFCMRTLRRNLDWRDDLALWTSVAKNAPQSFKGHAALANALFQSDPTHRNLSSVIEEADKSIAILDPVPDAINSEVVFANAGLYYMTKGSLLSQSGPDGQNPNSEASLRAFERAQQLLQRGAAIEQAFYADFLKKERALGKLYAEIPTPAFARLYANLAENSMRVGDPKTAYEAAVYARRLDPESPGNYLILSKILVAEGRKEEATLPLVEGIIVSGGRAPELLRELRHLYATGLDPKSCGIVRVAQGESLNNSCEPAHSDLCKASAELVTIYGQKFQPDVADHIRQYAIRLGCSTDSLN
jgi:protein O-mannosyl-transferase